MNLSWLVIIAISFFSAGNIFAEERPEWINNPEKKCSPFEICVVAEAPGLLNAEAGARNQMARVFSSKVSSQTTVSQVASSTIDVEGVLRGDSAEEVANTIRIETDEILEGVVIKANYVGKDSVYALASLNKRKAAERIKNKMAKLDSDNKDHLKSGTRFDLNQILKNLAIRNGLEDRYIFLKGSGYPSPVSKSEVLTRKRDKRKLDVTLLVDFKDKVPEEVQSAIIGELLAQDYRVVTEANRRFQYQVHVNFLKSSEYFNVKGFKKERYLLTIWSVNKEGEKKGRVEYSQSEVGRNEQQAFDRVLPKIKDFVTINMKDLNID